VRCVLHDSSTGRLSSTLDIKVYRNFHLKLENILFLLTTMVFRVMECSRSDLSYGSLILKKSPASMLSGEESQLFAQ
jgi:hypothetical protein